MSKTPPKWHHPAEVMKLHKLKIKKRALQARISGNTKGNVVKTSPTPSSSFDNVLAAKKRKNPFAVNNETSKRSKTEPSNVLDESADQTLFKLLNNSTSNTSSSITSFNNVLNLINEEPVQVVKSQGETWLPIDWTLKSKVRFLSEKPFPFNSRLKIGEESSGITGFTRCLDNNSNTSLDTSSNARFHQCCMFWQQPYLPWISLFPRNNSKATQTGRSVASNPVIRDSLQIAYTDSLRSLFQLIRTRQCPYFYACANNYTVLFRAAGICGFTDVHAIISPTTRGFRALLQQANVEFSMPLKKKRGRNSDQGYETLDSNASENVEDEEDAPDEQWLKSMGCNADDIRQINYTQSRVLHRAECAVDNSELSLILIEGAEVHGLYNFLINCKSATAMTGQYAGVPPTLLAPVAYRGATLTTLKVRENKVHLDDVDYYSLELSGPILPSTVHQLFVTNEMDNNLTATFHNLKSTESFSKVTKNDAQDAEVEEKGSVIFGKENLSDCGLNSKVLKHFCTLDVKHIANVECFKYLSENKTYTWS